MAGNQQLDFFDDLAAGEIATPRWLWARCPRCRRVVSVTGTEGLTDGDLDRWRRSAATDGLLIQPAWTSSAVEPCRCSGPYQPHSPESMAAAERQRPRSGTARARVLDFIESRGGAGATDEEIQIGLEMSESTERPRRIELAAAGWIEKRGTRLTRSGNEAAVWVALR